MVKRVKMKYILSLFALVLTGCGTSGASGNTLDVGRWTLPCTNESSGYSEQGTLLVSKDSLEFDTKRYYDIDCHEDDLEFYFISREDYTIGQSTKFSNGMNGIELNSLITSYNTIEMGRYSIFEQVDFVGLKIYSMYRVENQKLYFAYPDRDKGLDGTTASKRVNVFNGKYYIQDD